MNLHEKLIKSAKIGQVDLVRYYLECGADVHENNNLALRCAACEGQTEIVKLIKKCMNRGVA
jgi:hypothetical protein